MCGHNRKRNRQRGSWCSCYPIRFGFMYIGVEPNRRRWLPLMTPLTVRLRSALAARTCTVTSAAGLDMDSFSWCLPWPPQAFRIRDVSAVDKWSRSTCATTHYRCRVPVLSVCRKAAKTWHWSLNPFLDLSIHSKMRWPLKLGQEEDSHPAGGSKCAFSLRENDDGEQSNPSGTVGSKGLKGFTFSILSQL